MNKRRLEVIFYILVLLVIGGATASGYFFYKYQTLLRTQATAQVEANADPNSQIEALVAEVGRLVILPDEKPTVGTVQDKEQLRSQPFFANAENGDRVLIFANAHKALLYRPSTQKIIEIAPFDYSPEQGTKEQPVVTQPTKQLPEKKI